MIVIPTAGSHLPLLSLWTRMLTIHFKAKSDSLESIRGWMPSHQRPSPLGKVSPAWTRAFSSSFRGISPMSAGHSGSAMHVLLDPHSQLHFSAWRLVSSCMLAGRETTVSGGHRTDLSCSNEIPSSKLDYEQIINIGKMLLHDKKFKLYFKTREKAVLARGEEFNYIKDFCPHCQRERGFYIWTCIYKNEKMKIFFSISVYL